MPGTVPAKMDAVPALPRVLGVDAARAGWVGIALGTGGPRAYVAPGLADLVERARADGPVAAVGIDIPIGLPDAGRRSADVLAKAAIGPLRSSVFVTPVREALLAPDHPAAVAANRRLAGERVSIQAYGLRHRILEAERYAAAAGHPVLEVHPEVVFAELHGAPLTVRKPTWAGAALRHRLLADRGVALDGDLGLAGHDVAVDDVLDAAAVAWTARRYVTGEARSLPDPPEVFADGWPAAIWV
jgi:predicted RNase H-like nuclease